MRLFLPVAFALLAALFWIASGGASFDPPERTVAAAPPDEAVPVEPVPEPAPLTQVETEAEQRIDSADIAAFDRAARSAEAEGGAPPVVVTETEPAAGEDAAADGGLRADPIEDALSEALNLRTVVGTLVNVRSGPGTGFDVVTQVAGGDRAEVTREDGGWVEIRTQDGRTGWMSAQFLE